MKGRAAHGMGGRREGYLRNSPKKKKRRIPMAVISSSAAVILLVVVILSVWHGGAEKSVLLGCWRYDEYTEYEFGEGGRGCLCLDNNTHYDFTYNTDGERLTVDFDAEYVTDCQYTYSVSGGVLTLIGGDGTAEVGKSYELSRIE